MKTKSGIELCERTIAALSTASEGHLWVDAWVDQELDKGGRNGLGKSVCFDCGLGHCCRQPVVATFIDAFPIAMRLDGEGKNTPGFRRRLMAAGVRQETALVKGTEDEPYNCPLLVHNRCSVYNIRPVMCRAHYAFHSRDACVPYWERTDNERPKVCLVDHSPAFVTAAKVAVDFALKYGAPMPAEPWVRALPYQLSVVMGALRKPEAGRWREIWARCRMKREFFEKVAARQAIDSPDRVTLTSGAKL
jgi:Fe-S-cluster containining protein